MSTPSSRKASPFGPSRPAIVGHRGAPQAARENTLASFAAASAQGATWVELDVRLTADETLVLCHDPVDAGGHPLIEQDMATLAAAGYEDFSAVLRQLPAGLGVDVELKNLPGEPDFDEEQRLAAVTAAVLTEHLGDRPAIVSSFNPLALSAMRAALPGVPRALLTVPGLTLEMGLRLADDFEVDGIFPHVSTAEWHLGEDEARAAIADAHARGLFVMVWTVDDWPVARRLAAAGVDALCTNDPAGLRSAL